MTQDNAERGRGGSAPGGYGGGTPVVVMISGRGSNMEAIAGAVEAGRLNADIRFVGSDREDARGLGIARELGLKTLVFPYGKGKTPEADLLRAMREHGAEWLVLAGFMRVLSREFVREYEGRIVNIHPSLLPSFKGAHAIEDALAYGVKVTGVTVHLADEFVDNGRILAQRAVEVYVGDTAESLAARIHEVEHSLYPETLEKLFKSRGWF